MSFLQTLLGVVATQMAIAPVVLLTQILLARLLTVAGRGEYAVATEFVMLTVAFVQLGWAPASIYRLRRAGSSPARVATAALYAGLTLSVATVVLVLVFEAPIRARFLEDERLFALAVAAVPPILLGQIFAGVARGLDRFDLSNAWTFAFPFLVLVGLAVLLGGVERTPAMALTAYVASAFIASAVLVLAVIRRTDLRWRVPSPELRATLTYGLKSHLQNVLTNIHQRADVLLLASLQPDPAVVGLYAVAVAIVNRVRIAPTAVAVAMFPRVAAASGEDSAQITARVMRHAIPGIGLSVVAMAGAASLLVPVLFGARYSGSIPPLLLLLPGTAFLGVQTIVGRYFAGRDRQSVMIAILAAGTTLNVAANFVLIPRLAENGAALASLLSYTFQGATALALFWRFSGVPLRQILIPGREELRALGRRLIQPLRRRGRGR